MFFIDNEKIMNLIDNKCLANFTCTGQYLSAHCYITQSADYLEIYLAEYV